MVTGEEGTACRACADSLSVTPTQTVDQHVWTGCRIHTLKCGWLAIQSTVLCTADVRAVKGYSGQMKHCWNVHKPSCLFVANFNSRASVLAC